MLTEEMQGVTKEKIRFVGDFEEFQCNQMGGLRPLGSGSRR